MKNRPRPILLAILDGWGHGENSATNAVQVANLPNLRQWIGEYPFSTLVAHNGAVGLPEGQMGNSEVGHLNIGAGRIVYQDFTRINRAIRTGDFFSNATLLDSIRAMRESGCALHLLGLVSDGGVHSHLDHLVAIIELAAREGLSRVFVHCFMDGRDTPPKSGAGYIRRLAEAMARIGCGRIATVIGRYFAMDRDNRWARVEEAWGALVAGKGLAAADGVAAVEAAYGRGETDEFIKPTVVQDAGGHTVATVRDGDAIIFFNFRADRARQLTRAFMEKDFSGFPVPGRPRLARFVTFTEYEKDFDLPVVFPPTSLTRILGEEVSRAGMRQLRIAETEKYAHVTYFFNGGREEPFVLEDRVLIPSPKEVATYDKKPEMSAFAVTEELLRRLRENVYDLVVLNFANGDMVGHSGLLPAAVKACEAVDQCLGRIVPEVARLGGISLITSDHGNAEQMFDETTHGPHTAHTTNPVPFYLVSDRHRGCRLRKDGALMDIAPTILNLLGLPVPQEMEGRNLIEC